MMTVDALQTKHGFPAARRARIERAVELGADLHVLEALASAIRTECGPEIHIESKHLGLSRATGWARKGRGDNAEWGRQEGNGFWVGPGHWSIASSDGFRRKEEVTWAVANVQVGDEIWTVAN
jgi:hypothetical protein